VPRLTVFEFRPKSTWACLIGDADLVGTEIDHETYRAASGRVVAVD
jgi:hypothetical protein